MDSVLEGRDVLALMPTGGGKSLCYQLPAMMSKGLTIVVSPLIALMNDQVGSLKAIGVPAGCIHSGLDENQRKQVFRELEASESYILYVSPERIQKPGFGPWLEKQNVKLFAIDEAHCVSQWGHDFRKEYGQLSTLRALHPDVPMIALTATATPLVKKDIIKQLSLKKAVQHVYGFYRPNLYYQVEFCGDDEDKQGFVLKSLEQNPKGRVLIYCGTRKNTEKYAALVEAAGESGAFYHAGLSAAERTKIEKDYQRGKIRILAATNAFGMGIDHPDVRLVVHTQMPGNIESYYQEIGRAGRDGEKSTCLLAYSKKDKGLQSFFIEQSKASKEIKAQRWAALEAMVQYSEGSECRHGDILTYFKDEQRIDKCGHCDSCDPKAASKILTPSKSVKVARKKKKKEAIFKETMNEDEMWRAEVLRDWRREYAKEHDIPAFMVFSDKTLRDLVLRAPSDEDELSEVYGLGAKKIEAFGDILIEKLYSR